jgi:NTP pyrophosphatase (non-canonical NTP hydrolase)
MANQGRWPHRDGDEALAHKLAECVWWVIVLSERMGIDLDAALTRFLAQTKNSQPRGKQQ